MTLNKKELLEYNQENLDYFYDKIEDIRTDIKNVDIHETGSLIAALDFVDDRLSELIGKIKEIKADNDEFLDS